MNNLTIVEKVNTTHSNTTNKIQKSTSKGLYGCIIGENSTAIINLQNGKLINADSEYYFFRQTRKSTNQESKKMISFYENHFGKDSYIKMISEKRISDVNPIQADTSEYENC
jgi:hypothetical protein